MYFRIVRKYLAQGKLKNTDLAIVSQKWGILLGSDTVPYEAPFRRGYRVKLWLSKSKIVELKRKNLEKLRAILSTGYDEIFVNVGREFYQLIDGFEKFTNARVVHAQGRGLGSKATALVDWIIASGV